MTPQDALSHYFGWTAFRPFQEPIIDAVLRGTSVLGILPTSAGKSLCYQLPATLLPPVTLVISPLIALMQDQVRQMTLRGIPAVAWHSQLTAAEAQQTQQWLTHHQARLVYMAPERLWQPAVQAWLAQTPISLLVVDEAHCLSEWGFDFRPDYRQIPALRAQLGYPPVLALTATALPAVRDDIVRMFEIPTVIQAPLDRANLAFALAHPANSLSQQQHVHQWIDRMAPHDRILIYADKRRDTERWADHLTKTRGEAVGFYHAGLSTLHRHAAQTHFTDRTTRILVATTAFGMGIDIPDIRLVLHVGLPHSPSDYYQQVGRAGRDGLPSIGALTATSSATIIHDYFLRQAAPPDALSTVWATGLGRQPGALWTLSPDPALQAANRAIGHYLLEYGLAEQVSTGSDDIQAYAPLVPITEALGQQVADTLHQRYQVQKTQWHAMLRFWESTSCRRHWLLQYFGDETPTATFPARCCDRCQPAAFVIAPHVAPSTALQTFHHRGRAVPPIVALREWRAETAASRGLLPHEILSAAALMACVEALPMAPEDLHALPMTDTQRHQFGPGLLQCLAPYRRTQALPPAMDPTEILDPPPALNIARSARPLLSVPHQSHRRQGLCTVLWMDPLPQKWPRQERLVEWQDRTITITDPLAASPPTRWHWTADTLKVLPQRLEATRIHPSQRLIIAWEP